MVTTLQPYVRNRTFMASLGRAGPLPDPPACWRTVPGAPSTTLHTHTLATEALGLGCELRGGQLSRQALSWALGWTSSSDRSHLSRQPEGPITWLWTPEPPNLPAQGSSSMSWLPSGCVSTKSISVMCPTAISSTADPRNCWKCFSDFTGRETASHSGDWCASLGSGQWTATAGRRNCWFPTDAAEGTPGAPVSPTPPGG